jgi:hypothetical protein
MALYASQVRILSAVLTASGLTACSVVDHAIISTENGASRIFTAAPANAAPPDIDTTAVIWRNLNATSPTQFALIDGTDAKSGATRVVLKVPAGESVPAFWQDTPGTYTVLSGTFIVEALDSNGAPQHLAQGPGATARIPARLIQKLASTSAGVGTMLLTVQGQWKPNFVDDAAAQHAAN